MLKKFISNRRELESSVGQSICVFKGGVLDTYCVLNTSYGADFTSIQNNFDITTGCYYSNVCDITGAQQVFDHWMNSFF